MSDNHFESTLRIAGVSLIIASIIGLVAGLLVIESLTDDFENTLVVSRAAIETVGDTVETAREIAEGATIAVGSASEAAASAAAASREAASGLAGLAEFLGNGLPENIDAVRRALPGAIAAADAVDSALGALSLLGVDYSPSEPFGDSLRRVESALDGLPSDLANQSQSLSRLVPSTEDLADDVQALSADLSQLSANLSTADELADSYSTAVGDAESSVEETEGSVTRTTWLLRVLVVMGSAGSFLIGRALLAVRRRLLTLADPAVPRQAA